MIIARAPLRITLGGGGTDIPAYYQKHGGFCISAAVDKYVFVTVHRTFTPGITLKYSQVERVKSVDEIRHPIFREVLRMANITDPHLEISSHADIPAGTGLGSSSAFTVALLKALDIYQGLDGRNPEALAERACDVEINRLGDPIGKQDQYSAAFGGINYFTFCPDGKVEVNTVRNNSFPNILEDILMLFYTGRTHSAADAMKAQNLINLTATRDAGLGASYAIRDHNREHLADSLNRQWGLKLERDPNLDSQIIEWRNLGIENGAAAGKLIGAGQGGFLLFMANDKTKLRAAMYNAGLPEVRFKFDWEGCKVIAQ